MPYVCPRDGHLVEDPEGGYCPEHGSPLFGDCPRCGNPRSTIPGTLYEEQGARFCAICSHPTPWVSHPERILWIRDRLHEESIDPATALELREVLDRIASMPAGDPNAIGGWERLRKAAPHLWDVAKPVLSTVLSQSAKKFLGLP